MRPDDRQCLIARSAVLKKKSCVWDSRDRIQLTCVLAIANNTENQNHRDCVQIFSHEAEFSPVWVKAA